MCYKQKCKVVSLNLAHPVFVLAYDLRSRYDSVTQTWPMFCFKLLTSGFGFELTLRQVSVCHLSILCVPNGSAAPESIEGAGLAWAAALDRPVGLVGQI